MYKVFIENKAIIFEKGSGTIPELLLKYGPILKKSMFNDFSKALSKIDGPLLVYNKKPKETFLRLFDQFLYLEAAGGIVQSEEKPLHYLFIQRWGKWDLPKGKLEKEEQPEIGATREIHEECNVQKLRKVAELPATYHAYFMHNKHVLKKTHWFLFEGSSNQQLIPQESEDISAVKWFSKDEISEVTANTYASLIDLIHLVCK